MSILTFVISGGLQCFQTPGRGADDDGVVKADGSRVRRRLLSTQPTECLLLIFRMLSSKMSSLVHAANTIPVAIVVNALEHNVRWAAPLLDWNSHSDAANIFIWPIVTKSRLHWCRQF